MEESFNRFSEYAVSKVESLLQRTDWVKKSNLFNFEIRNQKKTIVPVQLL